MTANVSLDDVWKEGILTKIPKPRASANPTFSNTLQQTAKERLFRLKVGGKLEYWEFDENTGNAVSMKGSLSILGAEITIDDSDPLKFQLSLAAIKKGGKSVDGGVLLCQAKSADIASDWIFALQCFLRGERHLYASLKGIAKVLDMPSVTLDVDQMECIAFFPDLNSIENDKAKEDLFLQTFHKKFLESLESNLGRLVEEKELDGPRFRSSLHDSMTECKISIKPMDPVVSKEMESLKIFHKCSIEHGVLCIEFSNDNPLKDIEKLGASLMDDLIINGQPYSFHVKVSMLQSTLTNNLESIQKYLGAEFPMMLLADFEEINTAFPEVTPEKYGFTIYDYLTTLLDEAIKRAIEVEENYIVTVLRENLSQGYLAIRCTETDVDVVATTINSEDTKNVTDGEPNESVELSSSNKILLPPSYRFEDGSLVVYINDWHEFERQVFDKVFLGDEFVYKLSVGGVRYRIYREIMYFKPVADKHMKEFQNLLSCREDFELEVDFETSKKPLKESMWSPSSNEEETELCYAEVFYDLYMRSLVDNLRCILRSDPNLGPQLAKKLYARKIQIAPGTSVENTDFPRCHRSRVTSEGVLVLEYMQNKYCVSNIHLIGRDLDMCV